MIINLKHLAIGVAAILVIRYMAKRKKEKEQYSLDQPVKDSDIIEEIRFRLHEYLTRLQPGIEETKVFYQVMDITDVTQPLPNVQPANYSNCNNTQYQDLLPAHI